MEWKVKYSTVWWGIPYRGAIDVDGEKLRIERVPEGVVRRNSFTWICWCFIAVPITTLLDALLSQYWGIWWGYGFLYWPLLLIGLYPIAYWGIGTKAERHDKTGVMGVMRFGKKVSFWVPNPDGRGDPYHIQLKAKSVEAGEQIETALREGSEKSASEA